MLFNSLEFLWFFPLVLLVYFHLPGRIRYLWLLAASYYFYMCWNFKYAILLFTSTLVTYLAGLLLERRKKKEKDGINCTRSKKWIVALSFLINLGILFMFKYYGFATDLIREGLARFNIALHVPKFDFLLPVGISFYTFQALGYTVDVYRDDIYAEKNFFRYALFVSFFPQLVAGPIERSRNLLKQLAVPRKFNFDRARDGFLLMIWGYFLKLVLADRIAVFVDTVYGNYEDYPGWFLIVATILFAVQIYCDFNGYSTIAIGAAKILGIRLMENFNAPYLSVSVQEFWRKWHISLTTWFRDYLYFPMGGSRRGRLRTAFNKIFVFLVSGLWHGASLTYVVWGGLNGVYQVLGEIFSPVRDGLVGLFRLHRDTLGHRIVCMAGTFLLVDFSWIFFRADTLQDAINIIVSIATVPNRWILFDGSLYTCGLDAPDFWVMIVGIVILLFADICKYRHVKIRKVIERQDYWFRYVVIALAVTAVLLFGKYGPAYDAANFIYFQF